MVLQPKLQASVKPVWERLIDPTLDLCIVVPRAEVAADDDLVLKVVSPSHDIIKVSVPMLMNLFLAMVRGDKRHLRN